MPVPWACATQMSCGGGRGRARGAAARAVVGGERVDVDVGERRVRRSWPGSASTSRARAMPTNTGLPPSARTSRRTVPETVARDVVVDVEVLGRERVAWPWRSARCRSCSSRRRPSRPSSQAKPAPTSEHQHGERGQDAAGDDRREAAGGGVRVHALQARSGRRPLTGSASRRPADLRHGPLGHGGDRRTQLVRGPRPRGSSARGTVPRLGRSTPSTTWPAPMCRSARSRGDPQRAFERRLGRGGEPRLARRTALKRGASAVTPTAARLRSVSASSAASSPS